MMNEREKRLVYETLELLRKEVGNRFYDWKDADDYIFANLGYTADELRSIYPEDKFEWVYVGSCVPEEKAAAEIEKLSLPFKVVPKSEHITPHVVLEQAGEHALLFKGGVTPEMPYGDPYVVAMWYNAERGDWSQGKYFSDDKEARRYFDRECKGIEEVQQESLLSKMLCKMPDRIIPNDEGGFRYIYWNEMHDDGELHNGIAGCFEIHEVYAEDIVQCYEECGAEDFLANIPGYLWAIKQSSWCDADYPDSFEETLEEFVSGDGYFLGGNADCEAILASLYDKAVAHVRGVEERKLDPLEMVTAWSGDIAAQHGVDEQVQDKGAR